MNQQQFDVIIAIIRNGAPALANELVESFIKLVNERNELKRKLEELETVKDESEGK